MLCYSGDIAGGLPCELDVILCLLCLASLSIYALDNVTVSELPLPLALRLIVIELTLEAGAVWVAPFP